MPANLNLLPDNLYVSKSVSSTVKTLKALNVILIVIFIIFAVGVGAYFVFQKITLNSTQTTLAQLKSQIKAQEQSETKLILLKDRLSKIASIQNSSSASKNMDNLTTLLSGTSQSFEISSANVSSNKIALSLKIYSNEDLTSFISNVKSSALFGSANLSTFNYGSGGYSLDLTLDNPVAK